MRQAATHEALPAGGSTEGLPGIPGDGLSGSHLLASLGLGFTRDGDTTRLSRREHFGPLLVQKPLYPEGPDCCHAVIVHPPGGVVGGDELRIHAHAGAGAKVLLSTPGAAKWYRANGRIARQQLRLEIASAAALEWLPQETIFFNQADVSLDSCIDLHGDARFLGCEILCFGRTASGERFDQGRLRQKLSIRVDGKLLWLEQGTLAGGSAAMHSPLGLAGHSVCATLVCAGRQLSASVLADVRQHCTTAAAGAGRFGATQMKSVLIARYLGNSSETARRVMLAAWQRLRPALLDREAAELRIWNT